MAEEFPKTCHAMQGALSISKIQSLNISSRTGIDTQPFACWLQWTGSSYDLSGVWVPEERRSASEGQCKAEGQRNNTRDCGPARQMNAEKREGAMMS